MVRRTRKFESLILVHLSKQRKKCPLGRSSCKKHTRPRVWPCYRRIHVTIITYLPQGVFGREETLPKGFRCQINVIYYIRVPSQKFVQNSNWRRPAHFQKISSSIWPKEIFAMQSQTLNSKTNWLLWNLMQNTASCITGI